MRIRTRSGDAAALGARNESLLHQVGLVDFLYSVALFADCGREAFTPDRAAIEFVDDGGENRAIHFVEAHRIDLQQLERAKRDLARDDRLLVHLREVTDTSQQPIRDARRAAGARRDFVGTVIIETNLQQLRRPANDLREIFFGVELQMKMLPEAIAQRMTQQPRPGRGADQGERLDRELHVRAPDPCPPRC